MSDNSKLMWQYLRKYHCWIKGKYKPGYYKSTETISVKYDILSIVGDRIPIYFINNMGKVYPYAATTNTETFTK